MALWAVASSPLLLNLELDVSSSQTLCSLLRAVCFWNSGDASPDMSPGTSIKLTPMLLL